MTTPTKEAKDEGGDGGSQTRTCSHYDRDLCAYANFCNPTHVDSCDGDELPIKKLGTDMRLNILSSLSLLDVVRTSSISAFRDLWQWVNKIDIQLDEFNHCVELYDLQRLNCAVMALIQGHRAAQITKLVFAYEPPTPGIAKIDPTAVWRVMDSLLEFCLGKNVRHVDVDWTSYDVNYAYPYPVPEILLKDPFLTDLELAGCEVRPFQRMQMKRLRMLYLGDVSFEGDDLGNIMAGCPNLEALSLVYCPSLHDIKCCSGNLKALEVIACKSDGGFLNMDCPHIKKLMIGGSVNKIVFQNISSLEYVEIDQLETLYKDIPHSLRHAAQVIQGLSQVRHAYLKESAFMVYYAKDYWERPLPTFNYWKGVSVETRLSKRQIIGLRKLLASSAGLERLHLHILHGGGDEDGDGRHQSQSYLPCPHTLAMVSFAGDVLNPGVLPILQLFLADLSLQKVEILRPADNVGWDRFLQDLLPKVSPQVEFRVVLEMYSHRLICTFDTS